MRKEQQMVSDFLIDRKTMLENNADPNRMHELLQQEVDEVFESLNDPEHLGSELADVAWFLLTIANLKGIDLESEIREKAALNMVRYQAHLFQDGDYNEARKLVKATEKPIIQEFYEI